MLERRWEYEGVSEDANKSLEGSNGTAICLKALKITVMYLNDSWKYLEGLTENVRIPEG